MNIDAHLTSVNRKLNFLNYKLTPIRLRRNFQLNINLFMVFLWPSFSLALSIYHFLNKTQQNKLIQAARSSFKKFNLLPKSTSNEIVENTTAF